MRNPKKEIMLQVTAQGIMAHWLRSGRPDHEIVAAFGTHIIPTPYLAGYDMERAVAQLQALNPDHVVSSI